MMAIGTIVKWVGRVVFFSLLTTQCGFLAAYPAQYKDNSFWYFITNSYVPAVMLWICLMYLDKADLRRFFCVWAVYICCALLPNVIVIFGFVVNNIEKERFLGPNVLKIVLCITPLLLLLLVNSADDSHSSERHREVVARLSVEMAIDLFDGVEMLDIVLEEKEHSYGVSKEFALAMTIVACFSFFLSPLQMAQTKVSWGRPRTRFPIALIRSIVKMVGVNLAFLIIRVWVFFEYGKDESIFIAKNGIAIILSLLEIYHLVRSH